MSKNKINFAIIGVGYWGPNYARILHEIDDVRLTYCCDMDRKALGIMKRRYPSVIVTTSVSAILKNPAVDCVIVVTPAQTHFEIVSAALQKKKDVLVEKPLAITPEEAHQLMDISSELKRVLAVDHTFKLNAGIIKLRDLIRAGTLGTIYYMYGLYNALGPIRRDVSAMWDISPHFIYTSNFLLDSLPLTVSAVGRSFLQKNREDVVFMNMEYANGVLVNLHSSWLDPVKVRQLVVVGSKKMIVFDDLSAEGKLKIYNKSAKVDGDPNFADLRIILRSGDVTIPKLEEKEPLKEVVLDFISSVRHRKQPITPAREGYDVVKILSALQHSLDNNNQTVQII